MALIACQNCGQNISSLARFCPKCNHVKSINSQNAPRLVARATTGEGIQEKESSQSGDSSMCAELLQHQFKPSLDEMVLLQGRTFLLKSTFDVFECHAYLTSKRYVLCDASGVDIVLQFGINEIVFAEEGRHLLSKKIAVTVATGEMFQVKSLSHFIWFNALRDPKQYIEAAKKVRRASSNAPASNVEWFYEAAGVSVGPVKEQTIVQLIQNCHTVFPHTKVWNASLPEWKRADGTILTIYFKETSADGLDSTQFTNGSQRGGRGFLHRSALLFRKYF